MKNLKLNSRLVNYLLLAVIGLMVIVSLAGTEEVVSLLGKQSNTLVGLKAKRQALVVEQTDLLNAKKEIQKYSSLQKITESIVPQSKDQAEAVRELNAFAQQNNFSITGIIFPASSLGTAVAATPVAGTHPSTAVATSPISLSQLTPVTGIPGVYTLQILVEYSSNPISYQQFYNFLQDVEQNRLTSQVTGLTIQPVKSGYVTFTLTIDEYIKPR